MRIGCMVDMYIYDNVYHTYEQYNSKAKRKKNMVFGFGIILCIMYSLMSVREQNLCIYRW